MKEGRNNLATGRKETGGNREINNKAINRIGVDKGREVKAVPNRRGRAREVRASHNGEVRVARIKASLNGEAMDRAVKGRASLHEEARDREMKARGKPSHNSGRPRIEIKINRNLKLRGEIMKGINRFRGLEF